MSNTNQTAMTKGRQAFLLAVGKFLQLGVTFIIPYFLARVLEKNEYGVYSKFYTAASFLISIFSISIPASLYYFLPRVRDDQKRSIVYNSLFVLLLSSVVAVILICIPGIGHRIIGDGEFYQYRYWICGYILLFMSSEIMEPFYVTRKDVGISMWFPSFIIILKCTLVMFFAWILKENALKGTLIGIIVSASAIFLFVQAYIYKKTRIYEGAAFLWPVLKEQFKYILPFAVATILNTLARQFDKMVGLRFLTDEQYAAYAVAFFAIPGIAQIYSSVGNVYLVEMAKEFGAEHRDKVLKLFHELSGKMLSVTIPVVLIVALYAKEIITFIYTEKYLDSVPLFRTYIFAFIFTMLGTSLLIRASGKTILTMVSYGISAVFTLPLTYFAMKRYGAWGGVFAAMASQLIPRFFQMFFEIKLCRTNLAGYLPWNIVFKLCMIAIGCFIPFAVLRYFHQYNIYITVVLAGFYIVCVALLELRYDILIIDKMAISNIVTKIREKIS